MLSNPFQQDQNEDIEGDILLISEKIHGIRQANAQSDKTSNNDSKSQFIPISIDIEAKKLSSNSIKAAQERLLLITSKQANQQISLKRDSSFSYQGIIAKKRKLNEGKDLFLIKQPSFVKQDSLLGYFRPVEKQKLQLKKQDSRTGYERSSQKKRKTDDLIQKLSQFQNQIEDIEEQNIAQNKKLQKLKQDIAKDHKKKQAIVQTIYKELFQYQQLNAIREKQISSNRTNPQLSKFKQQYQIYGDHLEKNRIKRSYDDNSNNVLELYQKDRKIYMKEMTLKIQTKLKNITETQPHTVLTSFPQPAINYLSNIIFQNKYMITGYKFKDVFGNQFYQILNLGNMNRCLGRLQLFPFMYANVYQNYVSQMQGLCKAVSEFKHTNLLPESEVISYSKDNNVGVITISQCDKGSTTLYELLNIYQSFNQDSTKYLMKKVCGALYHIHQKKSLKVQQVITPSDIIIRYGDVKLTNFGYGMMYTGPEFYEKLHKTLIRFYYPPQFYNKKQTSKITSWSFGIVLYECIFGKKPFEYESQSLIDFSFIEQLIFPELPSISETTKQIIKQCLAPNPQNRISIPQLYKTEYFSNRM